ncbi:unnamed protein product [Somion occarium]|uniref:CST complex subunit STN1 n=1 Tax=Somion occarium TaxID=3059160 RepID=A0ABP1CXE1_9APHY
MPESSVNGVEFFWLGRVPCRKVYIVGLVVGVQVYEERTIYTLDDGTGVIECAFKHPLQPASGSPKPSVTSKSNRAGTSPRRRSASDNSGLPKLPPSNSNAEPKPIACVGMSVRLTGRVIVRKQGRVILIDKIERCDSINEEPQHWLKVCDLHRMCYFAQDAGPFVPFNSHVVTIASDPRTPSKSSVCSSAVTSPSLASSPVGPKSPLRLRHPSRLHTRDLTANTFRIYMKHYMDNAPPDSSSDEEDEYDAANVTFSLSQVQGTPTKRKRKTPPRTHSTLTPYGETPRPVKRRSIEATPRAAPSNVSLQDVTSDDEDSLQGFTMSHLRRVPELALLARRVVEAEAKRRVREERKKAKEQQNQCTSSRSHDLKGKARATVASLAPPFGKGKQGEGPGPKMKRLFRFAIRQLYDEGSIVLFDGPIRKMPELFVDEFPAASPLKLWKSGMSSTLGANSTATLSSINASSLSFSGDDPGEASDPQPDEESYITLTPGYLCRKVERAIQNIVARAQKMQKGKGPPAPGPTPGEILNYMRKKDDRWARLGEWSVKDALEWGKENGRVWCVGKDRWEVCG